MVLFTGAGGDFLAVPAGSLIDYAGATAPTGWLLCFGQAVNRTTYADLFAIISTTFGVGDGSTTFNVPDFRGRVGLPADNMGGSSANRVVATQADNVGQASGAETVALTTAMLASHTHSLLCSVEAGDQSAPASNKSIAASANTYIIDPASTAIEPSSIGSSGSGAAHDNMPPYLTINKIIKT